MGNLRKYMPYTYMTFLAGWLAICGIIPFSGFWSKDEILWNAASTRFIPVGWLIWLVGTIAATCTAFYMTRLVAMTFWGKEKFLEKPAGGEADEAHAHAFDLGIKPHDARRESAGDRPRHEPGEHVGPVHEDVSAHVASHGRGDHAHGAHMPHESPASMWVPLVVLAVFATIGGFVGISTAFTGGKHIGGRMNIVNWMDPVIWNPTTTFFGTEEILDSYGNPPHLEMTSELKGGELLQPEAEAEARSPFGNRVSNLAPVIEAKLQSETATEWVFIIISLIVAGIGIGLGLLFYVRNPRLPDVWAERLRPLYEASYHKFWVDEFYGWTITRRTMDLARGVFYLDSKVIDGVVNGSAWLTRLTSRLTGGADKYIVDGLVNTISAFIIRLMSPLFRAAQTGLTQNYALLMVLGLVAAVVLFFGSSLFGK